MSKFLTDVDPQYPDLELSHYYSKWNCTECHCYMPGEEPPAPTPVPTPVPTPAPTPACDADSTSCACFVESDVNFCNTCPNCGPCGEYCAQFGPVPAPAPA